jgi:hypothetical protein
MKIIKHSNIRVVVLLGGIFILALIAHMYTISEGFGFKETIQKAQARAREPPRLPPTSGGGGASTVRTEAAARMTEPPQQTGAPSQQTEASQQTGAPNAQPPRSSPFGKGSSGLFGKGSPGTFGSRPVMS